MAAEFCTTNSKSTLLEAGGEFEHVGPASAPVSGWVPPSSPPVKPLSYPESPPTYPSGVPPSEGDELVLPPQAAKAMGKKTRERAKACFMAAPASKRVRFRSRPRRLGIRSIGPELPTP